MISKTRPQNQRRKRQHAAFVVYSVVIQTVTFILAPALFEYRPHSERRVIHQQPGQPDDRQPESRHGEEVAPRFFTGLAMISIQRAMTNGEPSKMFGFAPAPLPLHSWPAGSIVYVGFTRTNHPGLHWASYMLALPLVA